MSREIRCPRRLEADLWGWVHRRLNDAVIAAGDNSHVVELIWLLFLWWQRLVWLADPWEFRRTYWRTFQ